MTTVTYILQARNSRTYVYVIKKKYVLNITGIFRARVNKELYSVHFSFIFSPLLMIKKFAYKFYRHC